MSENKLTRFAKRKQDFAKAESLEEAAKIVWDHTAGEDESSITGKDQRPAVAGMYQHYTTLSRVLDKLITRRWYLTRGDSLKLNDLKEAKKYGCDNEALMHKTYIMCFGNGAGESVAMWGIYAKQDPLAVRISLPRRIVCQWMKELQDKLIDVRDKRRRLVNPSRIEWSRFQDMIYVAVADKKNPDRYDIRRTNTISWEGVTLELGAKCDLERTIMNEDYAGWRKDYEWHYEREVRLCLRLRHPCKDDAISIAIPDYVINNMRFTFSPWLKDNNMLEAIKTAIESALMSSGLKVSMGSQRFRRSVLQDALNFHL